MVDVAVIHIKAGDGGDGSVHFRREKFVPRGGPDGGDGADGGSVFIKVNTNLRTLDYFAAKQKFKAENGQGGSKRKSSGKAGSDLTIEVPEGTVVWEVRKDLGFKIDDLRREQIYEMLRGQKIKEEILRQSGSSYLARSAQDDKLDLKSLSSLSNKASLKIVGEMVAGDMEELEIALGGKGGRGNWHFRSATNQAPQQAEKGTLGEEKWLVLELKLLADVGLVGLPNAGKSTMLSVLTAARPKIANYPFTTLEPNLGVMSLLSEASRDDKHDGKILSRMPKELVLADIPGLIEGASQGKGLGDDFLRHVERCKMLIHVLALNPNLEFLTSKQIPSTNAQNLAAEVGDVSSVCEQLWQNYVTIRNELEEYGGGLAEKEVVVVVNKMDLLMSNEQETISIEIRKFFKEKGVEEVLFVSAVTGFGLEEVKGRITGEL